MQGKLSEIDIRSILQLIELGQRTGELFVEAYPTPSVTIKIHKTQGERPAVGYGTGYGTEVHLSRAAGSSSSTSQFSGGQFWFVFFLNGQIVYATDTDTSLTRLMDYLRRYDAADRVHDLAVPAIASMNALEYGYLWALMENHALTPAQGRSIIQSLIHETLFDLLSLHQGSFIFEVGPALSPQLMTLEIAPLVNRVMKQVQEWKQLHPQIQSPDQCPVITNHEQLQTALSPNTLQTLDRYADGRTSIRQMARYLHREIITVARAIHPYVQRGWIQLTHVGLDESTSYPGSKRHREFENWPETKIPRVVCIDDGVTIRETVECILNQHGYEATSLGNPLKAIGLVFQLKPDLILCDIAMPELDGYEICGMLRKSTAFRQTPIVMLTGKDGFIDRVRARMVGATDYLTKPFGEEELLMLVEKYVGSGSPEGLRSPRSNLETSTEELTKELNQEFNDGLERNDTDATSRSSAPFG